MRIDASKNHSSIERVYGLDYDPTQAMKSSFQDGLPKGKRISGAVAHSTSNLIAGNYGVDSWTNRDKDIKPYSKNYKTSAKMH